MLPFVENILLPTSYNLNLVLLSVIIAILASYAAVDLAGRMTAAQPRLRRWWLLGGALAMGTGIWAMHFIGMLAFSLPVPVRYDIPTVVISYLAAGLASGVALYVVSRQDLEFGPFMVGGVLMGLGITAMHYIGMAAMRIPATVHYDVELVVLSVLIAIGASFLGLWIAFHLRAENTKKGMSKKIGGALVMGSAIPAMHYTGMAAASFISMNTVIVESPMVIDVSSLGSSAIVIGTLFILGFTLLTSMVDRRISAHVEELFITNERLKGEIQARDRVETALRTVHEKLEQHVQERTSELSEANELLKQEMAEREKAQREIASLAKFPNENPYPIFRITPDGHILYKNKASLSLLGQGECREEQKIQGWAYNAVQKALEDNRPVHIEVECGNRVYSTTFAPVKESNYLNVYAYDITDRRLAEEESHRLMDDLGQRVKELTALHQTARLLQDPAAIPEGIMQQLIDFIPSAWQYPDITTARFTYNSIEITTPNFIMTPWTQQAEFVTGDGKKGRLEVCYAQEKPEQHEGPFLLEERNLLNSLAEMLRAFFERKRFEHALETRSQFEDLVTSISTKFINLPSAEIDAGVEGALRSIGEFADVDRSYIYRFSKDTDWAYLTHEWNARGIGSAKDKFAELPTAPFPWSMQQLRNGKPVHMPRMADLPLEAGSEKEAALADDIKSMIFVPMIQRGVLMGFMGLASLRQEKFWEKDHVALLRIVGEIFAQTFERKHAEEALQKRIRFEDLIATLSTNFINLPTDQIDSGINDALRAIGEFAGVDRSYVFLFSEDGTTMDNTHEWYVESLKPQKNHFQGIPIASIPWGMEQLIQFQPIYIPRVADLPPEASAEKALIWSLEHIQSLIIVPMVRQGSVIGFLGFDAVFSEKTWDEDSAVLLRMVGEIFANAIERKQAEENLRLNQFFTDRAGDMILLVRSDARFCYVNEKACDSLGYSREELLAMKVHDISLGHQAEGWQDHWERTKKASTATFEAHLRTKRGYVFPAEVTVNFLEFLGVEYHCSFVRDITERKKTDEALRVAKEELEERVETRTAELSKINVRLKQEIAERERGEEALREAEKKYHSIVENAVEGIYQSTPDGRFISVNPALARMYGYQTPDELSAVVSDIGQQIYVDPAQRQRFVMLLAERGSVEGFECQVYHREGGIFWISEYARAVKDEQGNLLYYEGTIQDISARKQAEEELQRAKEVAEAASRAKTEFLANMSHELRTPLNGILGYAQILKRDDTLSDAQRSGVDVMHRSGEHLLMLINDILDLSKIEAQKLEIQPAAFQLQEFLNMITDIFRVRAEQSELTFVYDPVLPLPTGVLGDEKRLRQVLLNLLGNAVKFTDRGTVILKVRHQGSSQDNQSLWVQIEDTGIGISPEHVTEIFEPFRQVNDRRRHTEGTGLGLAITKKLVDLMGGSLNVASVLGQGSRFWFTIPLPESQECPVSAYDDDRRVIGMKGHAKHVLVVDDKWENRAVVYNILVPLGFTVSEAMNGREGVARAIEKRPDMILMDLVMPEMDGLEATQQIRRTPEIENVLVIALSASVFEESRQKSREAGCHDFLPKPIQAESLFEIIQRYLGVEWIYEPGRKIETKKDDDGEQLVAPPQEELATVLDSVKKGRIMAIREDINRIEGLDPAYTPFANELRRLTKGFQMKQLGEFLEKFLKGHPSA